VDAADARPPRPWSDYVGFVFWLALGVITAVRTPEISVLLLAPLLQELLAAYTFLTRDRPRRVDDRWTTRVIAYGRTFLIIGFVSGASTLAPQWIAPTQSRSLFAAGGIVWAAGFLVCVWSFWHLRASFSVEPAARRLITTGPYALARHPIYASYVLTFGGMLMMRPTLPFAVALAVWSWFALRSMRFEEAVLEAAFPEYAEYRMRVGALAPRPTATPTANAS
jgi:protein-S-isoprenylcysteine O-methyltransferase Ste14